MGMALEKSTRRNPPWTEEETLLAFELYLKHKPRVLDDRHPEVMRLSGELKALAQTYGVYGTDTFRNPVGVSMKLGNLRAGDPDHEGRGLPHGSKTEVEVWAKYGSDLLALAIRVNEIRDKIKVYPSAQEHDEETQSPMRSQGPAPFIGSTEHQRYDGENALYVFRLDGPISTVFSRDVPADMIVVKVGRSNDVPRRLSEMNSGFPDVLTIKWAELFQHTFPTAMQAHTVEQNLLTYLHDAKFGLGKEFAMITEVQLSEMVERAIASVNGSNVGT